MRKYLEKINHFKKDLDKLAELSWQEEKTRNYIIQKLGKDYYWSEKTAVIYKVGKGTPVFFRAELDGLNTLKGIRHTCGHSAHSAALMGAYLYFMENVPENFAIFFIFQPAEESYPSGAKFISDNFPELKKCRAGFAFHVDPDLPLGELANPVFASGDYFEITALGRSAHIKYKNSLGKYDAILSASKLAEKINSKKSPDWIVNVGTMAGGEAPNKIAGKAELSGDVRALSDSARLNAYKWLNFARKQIQKNNPSVKIKLAYYKGYPILKNNPKFLNKIRKILNIKINIESFGTEDFSLYAAPKVFLLIGTGGKAKLHSDNFLVDKKVSKEIFNNWIKIGNNLEKLS